MRNCLGCSAPLKLSLAACEFCGAEFAVVDGGTAMLPRNLAPSEIEGSIVRDEATFWTETVAALDAPFSPRQPDEKESLRRYAPARWVAINRVLFEGLLSNLFIVRGEVFLQSYVFGEFSAVLTNYRIILGQGGSMTVVPWHLLVSAKPEPYEAGVSAGGFCERLVFRWQQGEKERVLDTRAAVYLPPGKVEAIQQASEWATLTPLERELLLVTRRGAERHMGAPFPPIRRASTSEDIDKWERLPALLKDASLAESHVIPRAGLGVFFVVLGFAFGIAGRDVSTRVGDELTYTYSPGFLLGAATLLGVGVYLVWKTYADWREARRLREFAK
jgi:hypothetical protein